MVNVQLPTLGIVGEWAISAPERALAVRLVPALPAASPEGADLQTRFVTALQTLMMVQDVLRDNSASLFDGRDKVVNVSGHTEMINWMFAIARLLSETKTVGSVMGDATSTWMADWLSRVEPELAELRRLLSAAAAG